MVGLRESSESLKDSASFNKRRSRRLLNEGLEYVDVHQIGEARRCFRCSAELYPSAEALTYWGWMEYHHGNTLLAMKLCEDAIRVDPDFGNAYNDIGSYLVCLGRIDEAIPYFEKAIQSSNYSPRQFPHINLGRIFLARGEHVQALSQFRKALTYQPQDSRLLEAVALLEQTLC